MLIERLKRRLRSVGTPQAVLACALSLLLITSGSLVFVTTAQESPDGVDDRETFTVRTGGIYPHLSDGGQICADKIESDVNKVTVTDSTLRDVDIYLGEEGSVESHISFPSGEVDGDLVLYTNGENPLVNTLATLGICLPPGTPNPLPTTLEAYWLGVDNLQTEGIEITSGGEAPSVGGPELSDVLEETNTSREDLGINNSTETNNTTDATPTNDTINGTTNDTTATPTNDTINETTNDTTATPTNDTTNDTTATATPTAAPTNDTTNITTNQTLTNSTTNATTPANDTPATTVKAQSQTFNQGTESSAGSTPSTQATSGYDQANQVATEADGIEISASETLTEPVGTAQPSPTTTEDEDDGILSGILGPLFG